MNHCDKTRFDVISHLTDIPMLGKQYVPALWKQIEGGVDVQTLSTQQRAQPEPINQRVDVEMTVAQQNNERGRPHNVVPAGGFGGFGRTIEKRSLPSPSNNATSSFSAPLPKIPRIDM